MIRVGVTAIRPVWDETTLLTLTATSIFQTVALVQGLAGEDADMGRCLNLF